jgi:hypothetical protein
MDPIADSERVKIPSFSRQANPLPMPGPCAALSAHSIGPTSISTPTPIATCCSGSSKSWSTPMPDLLPAIAAPAASDG